MTQKLPLGSTIDVIFPNVFQSGLGIPTTPTCSPSCTISVKTVTFSMTAEVTANEGFSYFWQHSEFIRDLAEDRGDR